MAPPDELDRTVERVNRAAPDAPAVTSDDTPMERHDPAATLPRDPADTPAAPPARGGLFVPGFVVTGEIARGGMGVVLTGIEAALNREVAIKMLLPGAAGADRAVRRFNAEARITARLQHPGIPPVHQVGALPDGRPFLAMKLIRGRTLGAILAAREQRPSSHSTDELELTALDSPGLLHVFEQICQAVGYAHSQGVIHRDLKPANVMVGSFGEVQVMDWGIAKEIRAPGRGPQPADGTRSPEPEQRGAEDEVSFSPPPTALRPQSGDETQIGQPMGTPQYMPPEQARGEWAQVDARADVFALGGVLAAVLTSHPPYTGPSTLAVLRRAETGDLAECFARLDGCGADPELIELAKWCLAPDPAERPANAGEVAQGLAAYRLGVAARLVAAEADRAMAAARVEEAHRRVAAEWLARRAAEESAREAELYAEVVVSTAREQHRRRRGVFAAAVLTLLVGANLYGDYREQQTFGRAFRPTEPAPQIEERAEHCPEQELRVP